MASELVLVFDGNLNSDGTIQLDRPPGISPGRVQVALRPLFPSDSGQARVPDSPWPDQAISAPLDLPRSGRSERVAPRQGNERLPDPLRGTEEDTA